MNKYLYFATSILVIGLTELFLEGQIIITLVYLLISLMLLMMDHLLRNSSEKSRVMIRFTEYFLLLLITVHAIGVTLIYTSFITTQREATTLLIVESLILIVVLIWTVFSKRKEKNQI